MKIEELMNSSSIYHNVLGLVAVGEFEKLLLKLPKKLIRSTQLNICTSALLLQTLVSRSGG